MNVDWSFAGAQPQQVMPTLYVPVIIIFTCNLRVDNISCSDLKKINEYTPIEIKG